MRYEVIAESPFVVWGKHAILIPAEDGEMYSVEHGYSSTDRRIFLKDMDKYPHLFRLMEWWEQLSVENFPKYVKLFGKKTFKVESVDIVGGKMFVPEFNNSIQVPFVWFTPSTEQEYYKQII